MGRRTGTIRSNLYRVVLAALVPLLVLGGWQYLLTYRDSRTLVAHRLRANVESMANEGRDIFTIASHSLLMESQHPDVRAITPRCNTVLARASRQTTGTLNLIRTDAQGYVRCSGLAFQPGLNLSQTGWWNAARDTRQLALGPPQIGEVSLRPVVIMGIPLFDEAGRFDGTLSAGISLERLEVALQGAARASRGSVMIVDGTGSTVVSAGAGLVGRIDRLEAALLEPRNLRADDGSEWVFVSKRLFGRSLYLVYAEQRSSFAARALWRMWLVLVLPLLAAVLMVAAVWLGTQRLLLRWFPRLHQLARRFGQGDFSARDAMFASAPTEIADLAADLQKMAQSLEQHERELAESLEARLAITREVNHRVRNNLQIVISLLSLQASRARNRWERGVLTQVRARLSVLALIQRLAYEGEGGTQGQVNIGGLLGQVCQQLRASNRDSPDIELQCRVADVSLSIDAAMPLLLFAVEAITNAYRHAYAVGVSGIIDVDFSVAGDQAMLSIADHGQGFAKSEPAAQMGMDLMNAIAAQLGGKLDFTSSENGVTVRLDFPL